MVLNDIASLSAGQRQPVTVAHAMVENAPMLILNEATCSVDTRTEILIPSAMDKPMAERSSFVIVHGLLRFFHVYNLQCPWQCGRQTTTSLLLEVILFIGLSLYVPG